MICNIGIFCKYLIFTTVILCFSSNNLLAKTGQCSAHKPVVTVLNSIKPVKYIRKFYSDDLSKFHNKEDVNGNIVLGLMGGGVNNVFNAKFEVIPQANDKYCLLMTRLDVEFFALPTIHIARNFARGSCEYNSILKHELKHVDILKAVYKENIYKYKNYVRKISFAAPVLPAMNLVEINRQKEYMIGYINYELSRYIQTLLDDISKRQMKIDTPKSYRDDIGMCNLWRSKL